MDNETGAFEEFRGPVVHRPCPRVEVSLDDRRVRAGCLPACDCAPTVPDRCPPPGLRRRRRHAPASLSVGCGRWQRADPASTARRGFELRVCLPMPILPFLFSTALPCEQGLPGTPPKATNLLERRLVSQTCQERISLASSYMVLRDRFRDETVGPPVRPVVAGRCRVMPRPAPIRKENDAEYS